MLKVPRMDNAEVDEVDGIVTDGALLLAKFCIRNTRNDDQRRGLLFGSGIANGKPVAYGQPLTQIAMAGAMIDLIFGEPRIPQRIGCSPSASLVLRCTEAERPQSSAIE